MSVSENDILRERIVIGRLVGDINRTLHDCCMKCRRFGFPNVNGNRFVAKSVAEADRRMYLAHQGARVGPTVSLRFLLECDCEPTIPRREEFEDPEDYYTQLCMMSIGLSELKDRVRLMRDYIEDELKGRRIDLLRQMRRGAQVRDHVPRALRHGRGRREFRVPFVFRGGDEGEEKMKCDRCVHAGTVGGFPDGDMFCCECEDDPRVPFTMDEDTDCPLFEVDESTPGCYESSIARTRCFP